MLSFDYALWSRRHLRVVLSSALALCVVSGLIAARLPVLANVSYLLPEQTRSVRDLRALEHRANVLGTLMVAVTADEPAMRSGASHAVIERLESLRPELVAYLTADQQPAKRFAFDHRFLLASTGELAEAAAGLDGWLATLSSRRNPLALNLEQGPEPKAQSLATASEARSSALLKRLIELERGAHAPSELVSPDGKLQLIIVQTPFAAGSTKQSSRLLEAARQLAREVEHRFDGAKVGLAGDIVSSVEEERAILKGMLSSTAATLALVGLGLWAYYRSVFGTLALGAALLCGTVATFAVTKLTIGHLNIATAFLVSIVLGNGINFGIMLLASFVEQLHREPDPKTACRAALIASWRGTLAAALAASAAYLSLTVTAFRGFRDFGCIAGAGMALCWVAAYLILPPLLIVGAERGWLTPQQEPPIGASLSRLLPANRWPGRTFAVLISLTCVALAGRYLFARPFEQDFRNIRSDNAALRLEQETMGQIDAAFGTGISGGFVLAVDQRSAARPLLERLRAANAAAPPNDPLFGRLRSLDDFLPVDVERKRALLEELRSRLLAVDLSALSLKARHIVEMVTPPAVVATWSDADIPAELAWPFIEMDGSRGRLILASPAPDTHLYRAPELLHFVDRIRALELGDSVRIGGSAFVFADMVRLVANDGPRATWAALLASCATITLLLGATRHALSTLCAGLVGVSAMLAACGLLELKINFLDFVALPITIGIGIDYAVNLAARARQEGRGQARRALHGAGGAICLASYTTIIGYASMLLSTNRGIRSFGHAAILGEWTCLAAGLLFTPVLLDWLWPARPTDGHRGALSPAQGQLQAAPAVPAQHDTAGQSRPPPPPARQRH